jgi:hypothetical protein
MTIATKPQIGGAKEDEKKMTEVELGGDPDSGGGSGPPTPGPTGKGVPTLGIVPPFTVVQRLNRRRRLLSSLCIGVLLLWLLLGTMVAGLLLFRYLTTRPTTGFCGTDVALSKGTYDPESRRYKHHLRLQQKAISDPYNNFEKIDVPQFGENRPAVFVHDFRQNLTAIVDLAGQQCFIKPLDKRILPPRNFSDLMQKMTSGYYEQNAKVIAERWIATDAPLTRVDLINLNSYMIQKQCFTFRVYPLRLEGQSETVGGERAQRTQAQYKRLHRSRRALADKRYDGTDGCAFPPLKYVEFAPKHALTHIRVSRC